MSLLKVVLGFVLVAVAGCEAPSTNQQTPTAAASSAPATLGPTLQPLVTLDGEWRVAGIDGEPLDVPYGLTLSADDREIRWGPECLGLTRSYRIQGARLFIKPAAATRRPTGPDGQPKPVCTLMPPPSVRAMTEALDSATRIQRTPENGVLISGGRRNLLLFSQ